MCRVHVEGAVTQHEGEGEGGGDAEAGGAAGIVHEGAEETQSIGCACRELGRRLVAEDLVANDCDGVVEPRIACSGASALTCGDESTERVATGSVEPRRAAKMRHAWKPAAE